MKIAMIRRGYSATGGAEAYLLRLSSGLASAGHEPVLIATADWPRDRWINDSVHVVKSSAPAAFAMEANQRSKPYDMVFSMERIGRCDIYRAGDGVHRAWQHRRRMFEPAWKSWFRVLNRKNAGLLRMESETFSSAGARWVIANSTMVKREILAHFNYPDTRIQVIPNGFDLPEPPAPAQTSPMRESFGIHAHGKAVAIFAGSGWERKGLRFAIEAVRSLPDVHLVVAGRGKWSGAIPQNVQFIGPVADMVSLLGCGDVFVAPTIYDPFSNACLEALASGLPVITTDANGFSEIIQDGAHGSIVAVGDVESLKSRMVHWAAMRDDTGHRKRCRQRAAEFSLDRNVRSTIDVINRATARK